MKLSTFLTALQQQEMIQLVLMDNDTDEKIVDMNAATWQSLDDTIENREVKRWGIASQTIKRWGIASQTKIIVVLGEVLP